MKVKYCFYVWLLCAQNCFAERIASPAENTFSEHFSSNVPVSGNILVGAMYASAASSNNFYLDTTPDVSHFCFKVASIDGTYVSENDYTVTDEIENDASTSVLEYPTKFQTILEGFDTEQLAPLATTGTCSDQRYQHVLLSSRSENMESTDVLFMVSSGRSEVFMQLKSSQGDRIKARCNRVEEGKRTSYDTICKVSATELSDDVYNAQIARRKNGRSLPATTFTLQKSK